MNDEASPIRAARLLYKEMDIEVCGDGREGRVLVDHLNWEIEDSFPWKTPLAAIDTLVAADVTYDDYMKGFSISRGLLHPFCNSQGRTRRRRSTSPWKFGNIIYPSISMSWINPPMKTFVPRFKNVGCKVMSSTCRRSQPVFRTKGHQDCNYGESWQRFSFKKKQTKENGKRIK